MDFTFTPQLGFEPFDIRLPRGTGDRLDNAWNAADRARQALNQLAEQAARAESLSFWSDRMPGQPLSREAFALEQTGRHLQACLDLAYGFGKLSGRDWSAIRAGQTSSWSTNAHTFMHEAPTGAQRLKHLLLLAPDATTARVVYAPALSPAIWVFKDEAALHRWIAARHAEHWPSLPQPLDTSRLTYRHSDTPALINALRPTVQHPIAQFSPALREAIEGCLNRDQDQADREIHFDALPDELPRRWRETRIHQVETTLRRHTPDTTATPWSAFTQALVAFNTTRIELDHQLATTADRLQSLNANRHQVLTDTSRLRGHAMVHWATLQQHAGGLTERQRALVAQFVAAPTASEHSTVRASRIELELDTLLVTLRGCLVLESTAQDEPFLLLYRPGREGGLRVVENRTTLLAGLRESFRGAWPDAWWATVGPDHLPALLEALDRESNLNFSLSPITTDALDFSVQTQLSDFTPRPSSDRSGSTPARLQSLLAIAPDHALEQAFLRMTERTRATQLSESINAGSTLGDTHRIEQWHRLLAEYHQAFLQASTLIDQTPDRTTFARLHLAQGLRALLGDDAHADIVIDIPHSMILDYELRPVPGQESLGPVYRPSDERERWHLDQLFMRGLDDDLQNRLQASLRVEPGHLAPMLTANTLITLARTLDLPGRYEQRIWDTFKGASTDTPFERAWRRELLRTPFAIGLKLALLRSSGLPQAARDLVNRAAEATEARGNTLPDLQWTTLALRPGKAQDGSEHTLQLNGPILMSHSQSGLSVVYLPEVLGSYELQCFADETAACQALAEQARSDSFRSYLSARTDFPLEADAYLRQSVHKHYFGFIAPEPLRPAKSVATYLADLQLGKQIKTHRQTARSERELYLARARLRHDEIFDHLRLALSFVPFAGTVLGLYDGWLAANRAVSAFLAGNFLEGLDQTVSIMLSLLDALTDLVPGAAASNVAVRAASIPAARAGSRSRASWPDPFIGYETVAPQGWKPHADIQTLGGSHYIGRHGKPYEIVWDATYNTWRLKGNAQRSYRQPIVRTPSGDWQTQGQHNGLLVDGGLQGGGQTLTRLYEEGWETLIATWRRARYGDTPREQLIGLQRRGNRLVERFNAATQEHEMARQQFAARRSDAHRDALRAARQTFIEATGELTDFDEHALALIRQHRSEFRPDAFPTVRAQHNVRLCDRSLDLLELRGLQIIDVNERITRALIQFEEVVATTARPLDLVPQGLEHYRRLTLLWEEMLGLLDQNLQTSRRLQTATGQLSPQQLAAFNRRAETSTATRSPRAYQHARATTMTGLLLRPDVQDEQFSVFQNLYQAAALRLQRSIRTHAELPELDTASQRRVATSLANQYRTFQTRMNAWARLYHRFIDPGLLRRLTEDLDDLLQDAQRQQARRREPTVRTRTDNRSPRTFEVEEMVLIGYERRQNNQHTMEVLDPVGNQVVETFERTAGRWHSRSQPAPPVGELIPKAQQLLDGIDRFHTRLEEYRHATTTSPADLEDMATHYADNLRQYATQIRQAGGEHAGLIHDLEQAARTLSAHGAALRRAHLRTPTAAQLADELRQGAVDIRWNRVLEPERGPNGVPVEHLEEYRIVDLHTGATLWYAHFHFPAPPPRTGFEGAIGHLKLASERNVREGAWRGPVSPQEAEALFGTIPRPSRQP